MNLPSDYSVEYKSVKHIRIRVSSNHSVRIIVPLDISDEELGDLISKKKPWIDDKLQKLTEKRKNITLLPSTLLLNGERYRYVYWHGLGKQVIINHQHRTVQSGENLLDPVIQAVWCQTLAHNSLVPRVQLLAKEHNLIYNRVYIRNQMTKWGNCSAKKNISLNWRLVRAPQNVVDYVILHELIHTEIMKHSQKFWIRLRSVMPDYLAAVEWLEKFGNAIL